MSIFKKKVVQNLSIVLVSFGIIIFFSYEEVSSRISANSSLEKIEDNYKLFLNNNLSSISTDENIFIEEHNKGLHGKALVFSFKSKTNCLHMFKLINPLRFEINNIYYKQEENPKPAKVCHTNYGFGDMNYLKILN